MNNNEGVVNTYPCIKEFTGLEGHLVVLFSESNRGTVIQSSYDVLWEVGDYISGWDESNFKLFGGTIELRNN